MPEKKSLSVISITAMMLLAKVSITIYITFSETVTYFLSFLKFFLFIQV